MFLVLYDYDRELKYKGCIKQDGAREFCFLSADLHSNIYVTDYEHDTFHSIFGCNDHEIDRLGRSYGVCVCVCVCECVSIPCYSKQVP